MPRKSASPNVAHTILETSSPFRRTARLPYTLIACINQKHELLMVKRNRPPFVGLWNLIGGKIDIGETPTLAAVREINEEANIQATPNRLGFRGVAIWPDASHADQYMGMFLFCFQSKIKEGQTSQFGLLHEGVTAWISVASLLNPSDYVPVPNFELLALHMLEMSNPPAIICHEEYRGAIRTLWTAPLSDKISNLPYAGTPFLTDDLIDGR